MTESKQPDHTGRAPDDKPEPAPSEDVVEIRFHQSELTSELVSAVLWSTSCKGSVFDDDGFDTVVTAWIPDASRNEALEQLNALNEVTARVVTRERIDWLQHYEQSLVPIPVGDRFVIAPRPDLVEGSTRIPIIVPQEQAFGTGSHETTAMCVELLESLDIRAKRCLDVGTGSGILAIAMAKLGAAKVFAFDNDIETWGVIERNMERNEIGPGRIAVFYASADALAKGGFNAVTMNILPHVIIELLPHVAPAMAQDGALIVSGILFEQRESVIDAARRSDLALERERRAGEWWAGLLRSA